MTGLYRPGALAHMPACPPRYHICYWCGLAFLSRSGGARWCPDCQVLPQYRAWRRRKQSNYARRWAQRQKEMEKCDG